MLAKHIMRKLMTERAPNGAIIAVPVAGIGPQPQLNHLAAVPVQAERAGGVRRVPGRIHLGEEADGEAVAAHGGADAPVVGEAV